MHSLSHCPCASSSCHHCDQADEKEMEKEREPEPEPALLAIARTTLLGSCHHCDQADEKEMEKEREPEPALLAIARTTLLCQKNSTAKRGGICGMVAY
ncbi:hypothetical protein SKAU_G00379790 [Synaphobranchus kaupii]|uniref:Uncharacterized protein n=1 Tax=Synaphobranchus kaupii TaxID=118154 RepID=A0A9Q1EDF2_SYNKA|nr:hypothetical protein SKAU_G00379790 [Synaphobranchus kaupii]